jgi:hypothetical protein
MCGGGPKAPPDNSLELERMRIAEENRRRAEEEERRQRELEEKRIRFNEALTAAEQAARDRAIQTLTSRGLNVDEFSPLLDIEIAARKAGIPELDANPGAYLPADLVDLVLTREEANRRSNYINQLKSTFTPSYEYSAFADDLDDPILEAILNDQYNEAATALQRARARGTLNDDGYNRGMSELGNMRQAGMSQAQALGGSVLSRNRSELSKIKDDAFAGASGYTLGSQFDPSFYTERAASRRDDLLGSLDADVRAALQGQQFFDIGEIIGSAGRAQGAINPGGEGGGNALAEVIAQRAKDRTAQRGLGGTGAF